MNVKTLVSSLFIILSVYVEAQIFKADTLTNRRGNKTFKVRNWGVAWSPGVQVFNFRGRMERWLGGDYGTFSLAGALTYEQWRLRGRFVRAKLDSEWTMFLDGKKIPRAARVNTIITGIQLGRDIQVVPWLAFEPYAGTFRHHLIVNRTGLPEFRVRGYDLGLRLKCIIKVRFDLFLVPYAGLSHAFCDYKQLNQNLRRNHTAWEVGLIVRTPWTRLIEWRAPQTKRG